MLDISKALDVKILPYYSGKRCTQYKFLCTRCSKELWYRKKELARVGGLCGKCAGQDSIKKNSSRGEHQKKRPFERLFNIFKRLNEHKWVDLTYEQFSILCQVTNCHYCFKSVERSRYGSSNGSGYKLDRMNNDIGYTFTNLVTCCTKCNFAKGNRYSYNEFYQMTQHFRRNFQHSETNPIMFNKVEYDREIILRSVEGFDYEG